MIRQIVVLDQPHVDWLHLKRKRDGIPMSASVRFALDEAIKSDKPAKKGAKRAD
jgi:hypothetical protein